MVTRVAAPDAAVTATHDLRAQTLARFAPRVAPRARTPEARAVRKRSAAILDHLFLTLLREAGVGTVIECGAHEATASRAFMKAGGARAIAVEANPQVFRKRTSQARDSGVEVVHAGLSDHAGEMVFHVPAGRPMAGNASFRKKRADADTEPVSVRTTTVDMLAAAMQVTGPVALWVDVEGCAHEVLSGAAGIPGSGDCLVLKVEREDRMHWLDQKSSDDVAALVEGLGFVPVPCDIEYVGQFNTVYVAEPVLDPCATAIATAQAEQQALATADP